MQYFKKISPKWLLLLAVLHDFSVAVFIWFFAFLLRFNFNLPPEFIKPILVSLPVVLLIEASCFYYFGLYRGVWRFASLPDLKRIVRAVGLSALIIMSLSLIARSNLIIPRAVLVLNPLLLILAMGGSRFAYRAWKERRMFNTMASQGKPVLVIGVEDVALNLIKELSKSADWRVVAMIDPTNKLVGREIMHTRVEGNLDDLPALAEKYSCVHCMIALPSANHRIRSKVIDEARKVDGMEILTLPAMSDLISGKITLSQLRKIEVEDLLGRDPVQLDEAGLQHLIHDNSVLVSGAGGSIGSELCRQIARFNPAMLVCLDISEFALYQLEQLLQAEFPHIKVRYLTGDVKNEQRVNFVLAQFKPHVAFHAAAYKHVPMMEHGNVTEALANNVKGTYVLASASKLHAVSKFVLISTDKAVNPTNVMGASKRLAEMVCQGLQEDIALKPNTTKFVMVRFGNVLGSSGSVIPKFRQQIAAGGPITITHPDITRYFMSIPEAAQLVMQAGLMGQGGEVYVLDMGESVKIVDLAKNMIKLSGLQASEIEIKFTGLRPGEKLYEELLADDEHTLPTPHEKLRVAQIKSVDEAWVNALLKWIETTYHLSEAQIKQELKVWVIEYLGDINAKQAISPSALKLSHSEISTLH